MIFCLNARPGGAIVKLLKSLLQCRLVDVGGDEVQLDGVVNDAWQRHGQQKVNSN
jgi:hypothetical protein